MNGGAVHGIRSDVERRLLAEVRRLRVDLDAARRAVRASCEAIDQRNEEADELRDELAATQRRLAFNNRLTEIVGIPGGDCECFLLWVSEETYQAVVQPEFADNDDGCPVPAKDRPERFPRALYPRDMLDLPGAGGEASGRPVVIHLAVWSELDTRPRARRRPRAD